MITIKIRIFISWLFIFLIFANCCADFEEVDKWLLPKAHPASTILDKLIKNSKMFDSLTSLEKKGFTSAIEPENVKPWSIFVISHPKLKDYLIKKYSNDVSSKKQLENYLARLRGAKVIADYIKDYQLKHIVVPKKWLYKLKNGKEKNANFLLLVEKLTICPGGYWGGETLERYLNMPFSMVAELCQILHAIKGCDAWPQNQPVTYTDKIAFIDTEHVGCSPGDFLQNIVPYINPHFKAHALQLWEELGECP